MSEFVRIGGGSVEGVGGLSVTAPHACKGNLQTLRNPPHLSAVLDSITKRKGTAMTDTQPRPCGCHGEILCHQHIQTLTLAERAAYWRRHREGVTHVPDPEADLAAEIVDEGEPTPTLRPVITITTESRQTTTQDDDRIVHDEKPPGVGEATLYDNPLWRDPDDAA